MDISINIKATCGNGIDFGNQDISMYEDRNGFLGRHSPILSIGKI